MDSIITFQFLEAKIPLVKTYQQKDEGVEKTSYPMVKHVTSHEETILTLDDLHQKLNYHSRNNHCLLKGQLDHPLKFESRAGAANPMAPTQWFCLDFDYLESEDRVEPILNRMGLGRTSYILQYGAGHKIDKPFSAHLFFLLTHDVLPEVLKYWLMQQNFDCPDFERAISLARSNAALRWPLDISVAHNGILIYIAPPQCEGLDDPVPPGERIRLVRKEHDRVDLRQSFESIDTALIEEQKNNKLTELRKKKGLKAKQFSTRTVSGIEVLNKPGVVAVTGQREARGFMYLNLNGGDSWGYYHPTDNPEVLFNFKGEPNYLTREIVPEYYKAYKKTLRQQQAEQDTIYMAFLDRRSDAYFRGTYDPVTSAIELFQTSSTKKIEDFLKQHNQWVGEYIEEWDYVFRFDDSRICVPEERFLNRFQETDFLREARLAPAPKQFPPMIKRVLTSVMGDDMACVKRFLNWLAFIVQKRRRAETAWVLSGVEGTGKGLLVHRILTPLLGNDQVNVALLASLGESFNAFMENCVILMLDETDHRQMDENSKSMAKLKQAITDPTIPIHPKGVNLYQAKNFMSVIVASNSRSAITVSETDRRFNVAPYQNTKLEPTDKEVYAIEGELMDFASILYKWNVDEGLLRSPIKTHQHRLMQELTTNSVELMIRQIRNGELQHLIDVMPGANTPCSRGDGSELIVRDNARKIILQAQSSARRGEKHFLDRDEFHTLLSALSGESIPKTPAKFIQMLKHKGVELDRYEGVLGLSVQWKAPDYGLVVEDTKIRRVK